MREGEDQGTWAALQFGSFRAIWTASLVSNFGSIIQTVGASWLMTMLDPRADMVALVLSATTLPILMLALIAGAVADIGDRRTIMLAAQYAMLVAAVVLAALTLFGAVTPWLLLALTFVIGCGMAIYAPSWQASVGDHVPRSHIAGAVALNSMNFNLARTAAPAIGGIMVTLAGPQGAFVVNALTYVGLIIVLARWRPPPREARLPREPLGTAIAAGLRYVRETRPLMATMIRGFLLGAAGSAIWSLLPLIARDLIGGNATVYGFALGAFGFGAVVGALAGTRLRRVLSHEHSVGCAMTIYAVASALIGLGWPLPASLAALALAGFGWVVSVSTMMIGVQMASPRWVVGRTMSLLQMASLGGMAIGAWGWGHVAEGLGLSAALSLSAAATLIAALVGIVLPLPEPLAPELSPLHTADFAAEEDAPLPFRGPVIISISYRIASVNALAFAAAMAERGRIRRRDGARRWALFRDLADPESWVERFEFRTWGDYMRQRYRLTVADRETLEAVRGFHDFAHGDPVVRRLLAWTAMPESEAEPAVPIDPYLDDGTMVPGGPAGR